MLSSFEIILKGKRELFALLLLSPGCLVTVNVLWLFLTVWYFLIILAYFLGLELIFIFRL